MLLSTLMMTSVIGVFFELKSMLHRKEGCLSQIFYHFRSWVSFVASVQCIILLPKIHYGMRINALNIIIPLMQHWLGLQPNCQLNVIDRSMLYTFSVNKLPNSQTGIKKGFDKKALSLQRPNIKITKCCCKSKTKKTVSGKLFVTS